MIITSLVYNKKVSPLLTAQVPRINPTGLIFTCLYQHNSFGALNQSSNLTD